MAGPPHTCCTIFTKRIHGQKWQQKPQNADDILLQLAALTAHWIRPNKHTQTEAEPNRHADNHNMIIYYCAYMDRAKRWIYILLQYNSNDCCCYYSVMLKFSKTATKLPFAFYKKKEEKRTHSRLSVVAVTVVAVAAAATTTNHVSILQIVLFLVGYLLYCRYGAFA